MVAGGQRAPSSFRWNSSKKEWLTCSEAQPFACYISFGTPDECGQKMMYVTQNPSGFIKHGCASGEPTPTFYFWSRRHMETQWNIPWGWRGGILAFRKHSLNLHTWLMLCNWWVLAETFKVRWTCIDDHWRLDKLGGRCTGFQNDHGDVDVADDHGDDADDEWQLILAWL